jgi:transcriptional regulator with XRE-family HTH domain
MPDHAQMTDRAIQRLIASRSDELRRRLARELVAARSSSGLSRRDLAAEAGVDRRWIAKAEMGTANLTLDAISALATVLGTEASIRLFEATGPRLRDHIQVRLLAALLGRVHPRWGRRLEVPVYRPSRGVVDLVLVERTAHQIIGTEAHSVIESAERQLRWAALKSDAVPSADGYPWGAHNPTVGRLLVLRSTAEMRDTVNAASAVFNAAYPGETRRATETLAGPDGILEADTIVWVEVRGDASRLLDGPPRGVEVGR